jgi:cytochrome P450
MSSMLTRPGIPKRLVADVDIFDLDGFQNDVQLAWRRLQQTYPDIFWTPKNGGHWIATRAADIRYIQSEHQFFSNSQIFIPATQLPSKLVPLNLDPPEHGPFRAILAPAFAPSALDVLERQARTIAIELIESLRPEGECEFVRDFAERLPIIVFLNMMDLPLEDREYLLGLSRQNVAPSTPEQRVEAHKLLGAYISSRLEERKNKQGADLLSRIISARVGDRAIRPDEALSMSTLLLFGGLDTVASLMSFTMCFFATHPKHRRELNRNSALRPAAVEEMIRRHGISNSVRIVRREHEYKGVPFCQGDLISLPTSLAGLDEREVEEPLVVDFHRKRSRHAAFGHGPHICPGSMLARRELGVLLEEWLYRIPDFELKSGSRPVFRAARLNGVSELRLQWRR